MLFICIELCVLCGAVKMIMVTETIKKKGLVGKFKTNLTHNRIFKPLITFRSKAGEFFEEEPQR